MEIDLLIERIKSNTEQGQFEWVDNVLVKALERGYWLTISHANFCRYKVVTPTLNKGSVWLVVTF